VWIRESTQAGLAESGLIQSGSHQQSHLVVANAHPAARQPQSKPFLFLLLLLRPCSSGQLSVTSSMMGPMDMGLGGPTVFPSTETRLWSAIIHFVGASICAFCFARRLEAGEGADLYSWRGLGHLPWARWCAVLVFITSYVPASGPSLAFRTIFSLSGLLQMGIRGIQ